jgi:TonB family protein
VLNYLPCSVAASQVRFAHSRWSKENEVHKWFFLSALPLLTAAAGAQTAETPQSPDKVQTTPVYTQSKDGFRSQLDSIVRYYRVGDSTTGRHLIDHFRLPHPEEWFSEHLGPEQSAKLTERYERLFANFAESLGKTIEDVVANRASDLVTDLEEGKGERPSNPHPGQKLSGMVSVKEPLFFYCHFQITVKKKSSVSWADTFAHEDGAFRFVGFGAWPFWAWEDAAEGGAPKGGSFGLPATLITQVPPLYPLSAKARGIEGVVVVRLLIDKEGRVRKAEVVNGDPLLTQAALDAVRQWRYKPGTLGGAPAEAEQTVSVYFKLH